MTTSAFRELIASDNMTPLWEVLRGLTPREPKQVDDVAVWRADTIRQNMKMACEVISAEDAERRVLVLENPSRRGKSQATSSLYAGIQMILPGEVAPSHRHTASALRLILSGQGGYTTVRGEKVMMHPGDFVITPTNVFHDHGAEGDDPVMWLDGLDVPVVQLLNAGFSADDPQARQSLSHPTGDASARFASGLRPVNDEPSGPVSPLFHYARHGSRLALRKRYRCRHYSYQRHHHRRPAKRALWRGEKLWPRSIQRKLCHRRVHQSSLGNLAASRSQLSFLRSFF